MLLCHCRAVTDKTISFTIACGASTADDVAAACGAGGRCGGCRPGIEALLAAHQGESVFVVAQSA